MLDSITYVKVPHKELEHELMWPQKRIPNSSYLVTKAIEPLTLVLCSTSFSKVLGLIPLL